MSLSLIVIARDEERDLPACLDSVPFADEKIVVDSGSRDRTRELAESHGAKVIDHAFESFGAQKAFALSQAAGEWVLSLDADERLSPGLAKEIQSVLARTDVEGFELPYQTELFGRAVRYGGWRSEKHLRLFRRAKASIAPSEVHEGFRVDGRVQALRGKVLHRPYADLGEYLRKLDAYTALAAKDWVAAGRDLSGFSALRAPWGFFNRYILKLGFLDGYPGFLAAHLGATYDLLKAARARELAASVRARP